VAEAEFEKLVSDFYKPLYRFGLALTRSQSDAADLTQQTFYLWAAKGHQLRDHAKAKTWLFTSLYREHLSKRRQQDRFVDGAEEIEQMSTPCSSSAIVNLDGASAQKALLELTDIYRLPLTLFYLQEHSYREIAEILEVPIGTVMSRISRGKVELRKLLEDCSCKPGTSPNHRGSPS
jgi:RNA polymerase sigma-70 factor (ECF subfamily)